MKLNVKCNKKSVYKTLIINLLKVKTKYFETKLIFLFKKFVYKNHLF